MLWRLVFGDEFLNIVDVGFLLWNQILKDY